MIGTMKYDDLLSIVLKSMDESPARCLNDYKHVKSPIKGCIEIRNSETLLKKISSPSIIKMAAGVVKAKMADFLADLTVNVIHEVCSYCICQTIRSQRKTMQLRNI